MCLVHDRNISQLHAIMRATGRSRSIEADLINMGRISMISHLVSVPTSGGNAGGANCVFPFIYQGQQYWECIVRPAVSDYPWCATTENYDVDGMWGNCPRELFTGIIIANVQMFPRILL